MADAQTASNVKRQMADAYGAPKAKRQRRSRAKFACMVFGTVGDGKSMLCSALAAPAEDQPYGELPNAKFATAGGVTKQVKSYFMTQKIHDMFDVEEAIIYDTPGVGDADAKMSEVVGKVHALVQGGVELNCIIMTNKSTDGRVSPGMHMVSDILKRAFVKDKSKIVVALTKSDQLTERRKNQAKKMIEKELAKPEMFGGKVDVIPVAIPPLEQPDTGDDTVELEYPDKENDKFAILDLLQAMRERVDHSMTFVDVDMNEIAEEQLKRSNEKYIEAMKKNEKEKMDKMKEEFMAESKKESDKVMAQMQEMNKKLMEMLKKRRTVGDVLLDVADVLVPQTRLRHIPIH